MKNKAILVSITRKRKWAFDQRENEAIQNTQVFTLAKKKKKKDWDAISCLFNTQS